MRRLGAHPAWVISTAFLAACASTGPDVPARCFDFTYECTIPAPPGSKSLEVWVPVARDDPGVQLVRDLEIDAPSGYRLTEDPVFGNRMIHIRVDRPQSPMKITWRAVITRFEDRGQGTLPSNPRFLLANALIPIDGTARSLAKTLGVTDGTKAVVDRAQLIYNDVLDHMAYDKDHEGWGRGDFEHAVTVCKGNCTDFHSRFIGVGRAAGIPVRFTMGIPLEDVARGECNSYHCWAHFHDSFGWHPVDISEADKIVESDPARARWFFGHLDANRVTMTIGRDVDLNPPAQAGPRNYFVFPYAEADGRPVALNKHDNWRFRWANRWQVDSK